MALNEFSITREPKTNFRDPKEVYERSEKDLKAAQDMTAEQIDKKMGFREKTIDKELYIKGIEKLLADIREDDAFTADDMEREHKYLIELAKRANENLHDFEKNELGMHKDQV